MCGFRRGVRVRGVGPGFYRGGMADLVRVRDLLPGDEVTELDTPGGPWFRVVAVEAGPGTVTVEAGPGLVVVVSVGC